MANDWRSQYAPKQHPEIADFLKRNPGDEARIGSALEIEPWDGTAAWNAVDIPSEIESPYTPLPPEPISYPPELQPPYEGLPVEYSPAPGFETHPQGENMPSSLAGRPTGAPLGGDYGLAFRPGDINPDYRDYTDVDYLTQVNQSFPGRAGAPWK